MSAWLCAMFTAGRFWVILRGAGEASLLSNAGRLCLCVGRRFGAKLRCELGLIQSFVFGHQIFSRRPKKTDRWAGLLGQDLVTRHRFFFRFLESILAQ